MRIEQRREYPPRVGVLLLDQPRPEDSANQGGRDEFKTLTVAVLAAATVAIGGLAAAPSASAMPNQRTCDVMVAKGNIAFAFGNVYTGLGWSSAAYAAYSRADAYFDAAGDCYRAL